MERKSVALFVLLLVVLASHGIIEVPKAEAKEKAKARVCESKSRHYKGWCFRHHNCAMVCKTEGFTGGICRGISRHCFCTRVC